MRGYIEDESTKRELYVMVNAHTAQREGLMKYSMTIGESGASNYAYAMNGKNIKLILENEFSKLR